MATQFENIPIKDFIKQIKKLGEYTISSQADGLTFYFGFDNDGAFYTSPYSPDKRTKFYYKVSDYPTEVQNNQFKSAHSVLSKISQKLSDILENGQAVECQLVADAPTSLGSNRSLINIIRGVNGESSTPKNVSSIAEKETGLLQGKVKLLSTQDGEELENVSQLVSWKLSNSKSVKGSELSSTKLKSIIDKLQVFLSKLNEQALKFDMQLNNLEVASIDLGKIPVKYREAIKKEREKINQQILEKYKLPIKSELLVSLETKLGSKAALIHKGSDASWLGSDDFIAASRFDTVAKREVSGIIRTTDKTATIEERGGLMGIAQQRIADLLGMPELARFQSAKKIFSNMKGANPRETATLFANQLNQLNLYGVKTKILAILKYTKEQIEIKRDEFRQNATSFELNTGDGEKVQNSPESIKENMLQFAQTLSNIEEISEEIKKSKNFIDVTMALYSPIIYNLHGKKLSEEVLTESGNPNIKVVNNLTASELCHSYTATLLASQLLLRVGDKPSIQMLRDSSHASLKTFSPSISPFNFWGFMVFGNYNAEMKGFLNDHTSKELKKLTGRLSSPRIKKLHQIISTSTNHIQDWEFQEDSAKLIAMRLETRGQAINTAIVGIRHWDDIKLSDKNTIVAKVFYYLQQFVPGSPLLPRIRALANEILTHAAKEDNLEKQSVTDMNENLLMNLSKIAEAEMSQTSSMNALSNSDTANFADFGTQLDPSNTGAAVAQKAKGEKNKPLIPTQHLKFMNGKPIIKRKRDFNRKRKFERPINEDDAGGATSSGDTATSSSAIATYPQPLFQKGKKKRMIKRVFPLTKVNKSKDFFSEMVEHLYSVVLEWNDSDFSGNPETDEGFKYLKQKYGIVAKVIEQKEDEKWPIVKLTGDKSHLESFLTQEYGETDSFVTMNVKPLFGE